MKFSIPKKNHTDPAISKHSNSSNFIDLTSEKSNSDAGDGNENQWDLRKINSSRSFQSNLMEIQHFDSIKSEAEFEEKKKRLEDIKKDYEEYDQKEEKDKQEALHNKRQRSGTAEKPIKKVENRKCYKPEYDNFRYIDDKKLTLINKMLIKFDDDQKREKRGIELFRHKNRKELIKCIAIGIEELRQRVVNEGKEIIGISEFEDDVIDKQTNVYEYSLKVANEIEEKMYATLHRNSALVKEREEEYEKKFKLLKLHMNDESNFALRRKILNRTFTPTMISKANEDELISQVTSFKKKQSEMQILNQSVMLAEKEKHKKGSAQEAEEIETILEKPDEEHKYFEESENSTKKDNSCNFDSFDKDFQDVMKSCKSRIQELKGSTSYDKLLHNFQEECGHVNEEQECGHVNEEQGNFPEQK